ncbi:Translation initiation factor RLI1 [Cucumispora dikerogammari]|nr:Translation initiation factor RLI1 [Cucumispora dikerogammari]
MAKNKTKLAQLRLAIINPEKCKPAFCNLECKKICPINRSGKQCITIQQKIAPTSTTNETIRVSSNTKDIKEIAVIHEELCIGCSACIKVCPFNAIRIINLPTNLEADCTHRYGENGFKLHKLPIPKLNKVLGLVGTNGIGKSTAIKILSGELKPNLGKNLSKNTKEPAVTWKEIIKNYRGSELMNFFEKLLSENIRISEKIQYIDKNISIWGKKYHKTLFVYQLISYTVLSIINNQEESMETAKEQHVMEVNNEFIADLKNMERILYLLFSIKEINDKIETLQLKNILKREVSQLSGGELQRLSILICILNEAELYTFDEPSSFLDVRQRISMANTIRSLNTTIASNKYIIVVDHDLAILDLISDYGTVLYGEAGAYGVITSVYSIKNAINIFLEGYIPTENMRFRTEALTFKQSDFERVEKNIFFEYKNMKKSYDSFELEIEKGTFGNGEIIWFLGENGTGKTTFINMISKPECAVHPKSMKDDDKHDLCTGVNNINLSGSVNNTDTNHSVNSTNINPSVNSLNILQGINTPSAVNNNKPESDININTDKNTPCCCGFPQLAVSLKPQKILPKFKGTVEQLLISKIRTSYLDPLFRNMIIDPLKINYLLKDNLQTLSGGELQRIAIILCLGKEADIYLIDEPSAFLDSDQRLVVAKILKRFCYSKNKVMFIVEHDLVMGTYLADKIVLFEGVASVQGIARSPCNLEDGMNTFLKNLLVTFRRDETNGRPRINKPGSVKDREQKEKGRYFF